MTFDFPYPSQRMPLLADNVVATSQPLAAQAGLEMLRRGGNAVDAALAAAMALTVLEPTSNGIGGDAFCLLWDGERLVGLNASGRSPAALDPERFADRDEMPLRGWDAVTVPGAPSAWAALSGRYGRLPLVEVAEPAVRYAREGFPLSPITARAWSFAPRVFAGRDDFAAAFLPQGRAPRAGERWRFPAQADTLQRIAETNAEAFYRGELAERIEAHARAGGGWLRASDLAAHAPEWVEPIGVDAFGVRLHELPPNGQGLAALLALGILRHTDVADHPPDSAPSLHLQIEAMKLAFADAHRYVADPDFLDVRVADLLADDYLEARARCIDPARAADPGYGVPERGGTVYLSAADAAGMMVSFIQSNYHGFGSGVVVPGTGISLQNRGAGFTLEPGHPNRVAGGKRPFHTIIPGFVTAPAAAGGAPLMSFGVMGGPLQPQGHLQMVLRVHLHGQNPQAAADAPRWRVLRGRRVAVERGFAAATLADLQGRGHQLSETTPDESFSFGGAQLVARGEGGWVAGSDPRKDGQAVGF